MNRLIAFFGAIFLLVGILGFIPNVLVGQRGYFHADLVHNILHIVLGAVLVGASLKTSCAIKATKTVGVLLVVLAILGFALVSGEGSLLDMMEVNNAGNWLHLILGIIIGGYGFFGPRSPQK